MIMNDSFRKLLATPVTRNLVVMIAIACEGEVPDLETDLANLEALEYGLKALINLDYQNKLGNIQSLKAVNY
jgi:hypothetical protein